MAAKPMFRSEALDARGRIEALPTTMHVTNSWTRAVVVGMALTVLAAVAASAYVVVPVQITGNGVVIDRSGYLLTAVSASAGGFVEALHVRAGDHVIKGQPIGQLALPEQSAAIVRLRDTIEGLERDDKAMAVLAGQDRRTEAAIREKKSKNLDSQIASYDRRVGWLREREAAEIDLLQKGASTEPRTIAARIAAQEAVTQRDQAQFERASLDSTALEADGRRERERLNRALRIEQTKLDLIAAQRNLVVRNALVSPVDGVVAEIHTRVGAAVNPGQAVVVITTEAGGRADALEGVIFVPLASGKQVSTGDQVLLAPASLQEGEHDRLVGRVKSVSGTVSTKNSLLATLGSDQLVELAVRQGPVFRVIVELESNPSAPSGFVWTSGHGPNLVLSRGTPVSARVAVEHATLLSLALPALRGLFHTQKSSWTGTQS